MQTRQKAERNQERNKKLEIGQAWRLWAPGVPPFMRTSLTTRLAVSSLIGRSTQILPRYTVKFKFKIQLLRSSGLAKRGRTGEHHGSLNIAFWFTIIMNAEGDRKT